MATRRRSNSSQARKRKSSKARSGNGLPGWLWGLGGLSVGLFVALLVNLELNTDGQDLDAILDTGKPGQERSQDGGQTASDEGSGEQETADDAAAADDDDPDFEFYRVLPEQEVDVPERETTGEDAAASNEGPDEPAGNNVEQTSDDALQAESSDGAGPFVLQAGSFQEVSSADRMKAELALLGVEAHIESANLAGGETWHRVRAGPYNDRRQVNKLRQRLSQNDIDTIILGGKD